MKILKISGKNLASLAGHFSVDFEQEPLASCGLFAISGPTGAGKSTLLDALCLALYDATPRMSKSSGRGSAVPDVGSDTVAAQDPRTLLRRGAAEGHAEVDFVGNDGSAYRARWRVRRSYAKASGKLQLAEMELWRLPALQAIGGTKTEVKSEIELRIGLSFEQFTRAVLLAQNEFSTFLKTEDNERGELLETLTGSTIYSDISVRAFERAKREKEALQLLSLRLADHKPLSVDDRSALKAQSGTADDCADALDQRKTLLEQQLRWHEQARKLEQDAQQAQQTLHLRRCDVDAAQPRRVALAQLETVQAARPLHDDVTRMTLEIAGNDTVIGTGERAADAAALAQQTCQQHLQQAAQLLQQGEDEQRGAAPLLDLAKALDVRIAALLPGHLEATRSDASTAAAAAQALQDWRQKQDQHAQLRAAHVAGSSWLDQHRQWQTLAQAWPRWDLLFVQAEQARAQAQHCAQAQIGARQSVRNGSVDDTDANARLVLATAALEQLELLRQQTIRERAAFDAAAVLRQRQQGELRRDQLAQAEKIRTEQVAMQMRSSSVAQQSMQLRAARDAAGAALPQEQALAERAAAALAQAERSLHSAQAACSEHVETLRATLQIDQNCPVCGALEHPYRDQGDNAALHAMLASLQLEVANCRSQSQQCIEQQAHRRAVAAATTDQLAALMQETDAATEPMARLALAWKAACDTLQLDAGQDAGNASGPDAGANLAPGFDAGPWLQQQLRAVQTTLHAAQQQELAIGRAHAAQDQAQHAHDVQAREHGRLLAQATDARSKLAQVQAELLALSQQHDAITARQKLLLDELEHAFQSGDSVNWRAHWLTDPATFHAQRQADSKHWLTQRAAHDERSAADASLQVELQALTQLLARAERDAQVAHAVCAAQGATLKQMQAERLALWDGKPVRDIEAALSAAIALAKTQLQSGQSASLAAQQTRARMEEALTQARQRQTVLAQAILAARARLDDWLQQQRQADSGQNDKSTANTDENRPLDLIRLRALLAVCSDDITAQRVALHAIEAAATDAATVLTERLAQRAQHQQSAPEQRAAPAGEEQDGAALSGEEPLLAALAALALERKHAHAAANALTLLLAQDDARRIQAQAMLADIEQQEQSERRWSSMNELIGSADGKKFRNYAQQFTLDVLLGYANAHLAQLAKRYRLERINHQAHPSLGLMVRDQDMGGELRSVHSLSGGESFLVSLALALGLASLSSNRVRVESLFIDEGFGSLDSETLRVALDALDGLQSMGRKVGVISHVQEMTERISTRIVVQPAAGGKSHVSVQQG
jgi:exonuclease SbcC